MAFSGAGNAELNALLRSRAEAGTTGAPIVPTAGPRMSAREQLAQPRDQRITDMLSRGARGSVSQVGAQGVIDQQAAAALRAQQADAAAKKEAADRQQAMDLKLKPIETAGDYAAARTSETLQANADRQAAEQKGAMDRQTAGNAAASERLKATIQAKSDELVKTGKVVGSPEYKQAMEDALVQTREAAKATGDIVTDREAAKLQVAALYGAKDADGNYEHIPTPEEISAIFDGKPVHPLKDASAAATPEQQAALQSGQPKDQAAARRAIQSSIDVNNDGKMDWKDHDAAISGIDSINKMAMDDAALTTKAAQTGKTVEQLREHLDAERKRLEAVAKSFQSAEKLKQSAKAIKTGGQST
jgi:hypothetical protein